MEKLKKKFRRRSKSLEHDYLTTCTLLTTTEQNVYDIDDKYKKLYDENKQLKLDKETLETEKDELLSRLSKLAGHSLTKGNMDITNLGNPNTPAKIGKRWDSLYTDEWIDAYEEIVKQLKSMGNENDALPEKRLLNIVDWCYKKCKEIAEHQKRKLTDNLWEVVNHIHLLGIESPTPTLGKPANGKYATENQILQIAIEPFIELASAQCQTSSSLSDAVINKCVVDYSMSTSTILQGEKKFLTKCSELCWLMCIADPHMAIEYDDLACKEIDVNKFNKYSNNGTIVDYVVWPALLLSKDGPVVTKGTVQTNDKKSIPKHYSSDELPTPCSANATNYHFDTFQCLAGVGIKEDNRQMCSINDENTVDLSYHSYQKHDETSQDKHIAEDEVFYTVNERYEGNKQTDFKSAAKSTWITNDSQSKHVEEREKQLNQATSRPENTHQEHDPLSYETEIKQDDDKYEKNFTDYTKDAMNIISIGEIGELRVQTNRTLSDDKYDDEGISRKEALSKAQRIHSTEEKSLQKTKYYMKNGMQKGNHTGALRQKLEKLLKNTDIPRKLSVGKESPTDH